MKAFNTLWILLTGLSILSCDNSLKVPASRIVAQTVGSGAEDRPPPSVEQPMESLPAFVIGQNSTSSVQQFSAELNKPYLIHSDGTRLYVADRFNHRVLVWNKIPNSASDLPDFALGQPNLHSVAINSGGVSGSSMYFPEAITTCSGKLFVLDRGNNRVLVWNSVPNRSAAPADFALGQPDFQTVTSNTGGVSASSLSSSWGLSCHSNRLVVADSFNNRVLVWNTIPTMFAQAADVVLGQASFSGSAINAGASVTGSSMFYVNDVFTDGERLFAADVNNHRVLIWSDVSSLVNNQPADIVLGQTDFINRLEATSATGMRQPSGVFSDGTRLFVADSSNNRLLVWNTLPSASTTPADFVLGQSNFTASAAGTTLSGMNNPYGIYSNGKVLIVSEYNNNRLLFWNSLSMISGQAADFSLGVTPKSASSLNKPYGGVVVGERFFVADRSNHRILAWNKVPEHSGIPADYALGQPDLTSTVANNGGVRASSMHNPYQVLSDGQRLFVVDTFNHRILVWNEIPTRMNQPADFALGQPNLQSSSALNPPTASSMGGPCMAFISGNRFYVGDYLNNRVLIWNSIPTTMNQPADLVLGQADFTTKVSGMSAEQMNGPYGMASDGTRLFVSDYSNHRVLVWNSLPTSSGTPADLVLGQPDFGSGDSNNGGISSQSLYWPAELLVKNSRLYVVDHNNHRVLAWNSIPTTNGQGADLVIGQSNFTSNSPNASGISEKTLNAPQGITSDSQYLYIGDAGNHRILAVPVADIGKSENL
jgi:hypothetical protein